MEVTSASDPDMLEGSELEGAVVADAIVLEVRDAARFVSVRFHVDDPALLEPPSMVAEERPFRVEFDTRTLQDGGHTITITAGVTSGPAPIVTKRFVVSNGDERPQDESAEEDAPADGTSDEREDASGEEGPYVDPTEPGHDGSAEDGGDSADLPAATLFVSPHGDDGNDGRSAARPLQSVRRAAVLVRPGDVVSLRGGVYPIGVEFRTSGTRSEPIVWASYPGERAVFDGAEHEPAQSVAKFHVRSSWNVFVNLDVRNAPQEGVYVEEGHDNVFRGIVTHGNHYSGIGNVRSDRNLYEDIVTYDNFDDQNPTGPQGHGADGIAITSGDSNTIRRVVAFDNSDDGIDVWLSTNTRIESTTVFRNGRGADGDGNGIKAGGAGAWNGTIVRHVVSFDNRGNGFDENGGDGILFENSTAYGNGGWDFMGKASTTRRNNLAPASSTGMWGSQDERNSWNLGIPPRFESVILGSDGFLALRRDSEAVGAGVGGADLGAIPAGSSFRELIGPVAYELLSSRW